jgi:hypothetical protein
MDAIFKWPPLSSTADFGLELHEELRKPVQIFDPRSVRFDDLISIPPPIRESAFPHIAILMPDQS